MSSLKTKWRPVFAWVFIFFFAATGVSVLGLLWLGNATLDAASGVLITMLAMGGGVTGTYAAGRSYEKAQGVADPSTPPIDYQEGS